MSTTHQLVTAAEAAPESPTDPAASHLVRADQLGAIAAHEVAARADEDAL